MSNTIYYCLSYNELKIINNNNKKTKEQKKNTQELEFLENEQNPAKRIVLDASEDV